MTTACTLTLFRPECREGFDEAAGTLCVPSARRAVRATCPCLREHRPAAGGAQPPMGRPQVSGRPAQVSLFRQNLATGRPLVKSEGNTARAYQAAKRLTDLIGAAALLVLLGPIMLAVLAVLVVTTRGQAAVLAAPGRALGPAVHDGQVPHHAAGRRTPEARRAQREGGPDLQEPARPPHHPAGPLAAEDEPGRDAPVVPRAVGPDVAGRAAAAGRARSGPLRRPGTAAGWP